MAIRFQNFRAADKADTPDYMQAAIAEGNFKQQAKQRANSLRAQNMMGAAGIYNKGMGDRTPIGDRLWGPADPMAGYSEADIAAQQTADQVGAEAGADAFTGEGIGLEGLEATGLDTVGGDVAGEVVGDVAADAALDLGGEALATTGAEALAAGGTGAAAGGAAAGGAGSAAMGMVPGIGQAAMVAMALRELFS